MPRLPARSLLLPLLALSACAAKPGPEPSATPEPAVAPPEPGAATDEGWPEAPSGLPEHELAAGESLMINTGLCAAGQWYAALPFGSAWIKVAAEGDSCLIWLGGETENPDYGGEATGFCRVARDEGPALELVVGDGGPAWIDHPACARQ